MRKKLKKKIDKVKVKDLFIENILFYIMIFIVIIFVTSPIWLNNLGISKSVSAILTPLKTEGYKSSYMETVGALVGTAFAICGALWTQRRFDKKVEEDRRREKLLIIYYDFKFVFDDIKKYMKMYLYKKGGAITSKLYNSDIGTFRIFWKNFKVHIYNDWIANVASISKYFTKEEIKQIYELYGDIDEIGQIFKEPMDKISDSELKSAYSKMFNYVIVISDLKTRQVEMVEIREDIIKLLEKLQKIGEL